MEHRRGIGKQQWLGGSALLCLALAACNKSPQAAQPATGAPIAALQLATAPPPPPTYAPPVSALPPAPRRVAYRPSREHWRYLTDAYDMSDAFADTPPDYTVPYDGEDPYVWRADDGAYRVVEWLPDGARYYYYEPGANEPFLIQDPEYSYAYDNGTLVAVYTLAGALVADRIAAEREGYAARYYARGHDLYRAAVNDRRRAAYAANWQQRAPMIQAQRTRWQRGRDEQPEWHNWYQAHQTQQDARWAPERQHRATYAAALGAAGVAGAAYAIHRHDQQAAQRAAEARPAPQPPTGMDRRPGAFPNGNPGAAGHYAGAGHAQPGVTRGAAPAPGAHDQHGAGPGQSGPGRQLVRAQPAPPQTAQPNLHGPRNPQDNIAARQAMAHAEQAQHQAAQQAQQAQRHELQQAQQAQRAAAQAQRQAAQTQHADMQARTRQAQQTQHQELQQAQRAAAQAQRQAAQMQHADMQARTRQAQQAQHRELQQAQQAQRAGAQLQAQAQRAQAHAEARVAPQAPHPAPVAHMEAPHPQATHPAPQPHGNGHGGGHKDDRHPQ